MDRIIPDFLTRHPPFRGGLISVLPDRECAPAHTSAVTSKQLPGKTRRLIDFAKIRSAFGLRRLERTQVGVRPQGAAGASDG
jgi:hypothetical protein